ncbi:hypothetical protein [Paramicrobacterium humi]|uniref:hypothetical protein n=1 Tax=Paramicrobacterium humi TaxID=640635 RepID=UPI000B837348|nr:hypothetical protein [Microbacterium humi]
MVSQERSPDIDKDDGCRGHAVRHRRPRSRRRRRHGLLGEPTGLIVGLGSALPHRGITEQRFQGRVWTVVFDEPQMMRDGRGPFERAEISEESLVAAPPLDA